MLGERVQQQQRILEESNPSLRCFSYIRQLGRKRHSLTVSISDQLKRVRVVVASASDRSLRYNF